MEPTLDLSHKGASLTMKISWEVVHQFNSVAVHFYICIYIYIYIYIYVYIYIYIWQSKKGGRGWRKSKLEEESAA